LSCPSAVPVRCTLATTAIIAAVKQAVQWTVRSAGSTRQ
jgi:hypothetical protein